MANRFKFDLQKVLEIREDKEKESVRLFKDSQEAVINAESELRNLNEKYDEYKIIRKNESAAFQKIKRNYINSLAGVIKQKEKELLVKKNDLERRRRDLLEKQKEKKTVEIIKNKRYDQFIKEENRKEQVVLDELALYSYFKKE
ncbi:MAG: flagellar export protein FliJ [Inconstantimicrobium porci]|uniref:Flagellar FliJ protein n=1 Tax=Inconstantimicrobium porci TaxID=2652291 RepID=A0A7X2MXW1_9CLOT|nr:flagellar export protein FliJ [Inconstantimicrobium porci]MDD6770678.1 flagellar export protein FliJ [Inconstantimicrobium porci]MDY5911597.1 flagellar export protein FliJ [Inconstantimicrobium porci]MSR91077.1 flagellar export protein FliJ [Inconstantimicrobium porci]